MIISLSNVFKEEKLKRMTNEHIRKENIGCTGKKNVFAEGSKQKQCVHIKICALKEDLVYLSLIHI